MRRGHSSAGIFRGKENLLPHSNLPAGTHQRLPLQRPQLAREQDLHAAMKKIARGRIPGADRLCPQASAASIKAGRKDAAAVQYQQVAGAKQAGEISELPIYKITCGAREMQQSGTAAVHERLLGNQLFREVEIKVRNQHQLDYRRIRRINGRLSQYSMCPLSFSKDTGHHGYHKRGQDGKARSQTCPIPKSQSQDIFQLRFMGCPFLNGLETWRIHILFKFL